MLNKRLLSFRGGGGTGLGLVPLSPPTLAATSPRNSFGRMCARAMTLVCLVLGTMMGTAWAQEFSENPYGLESTANPYGQYGSPFGVESANNPFGRGIPLETRRKDSGLGIEDWGDQKSAKLESRTEALDEALARQRQELEAERIELTAETERLAKEFEAKIQAEIDKQVGHK